MMLLSSYSRDTTKRIYANSRIVSHSYYFIVLIECSEKVCPKSESFQMRNGYILDESRVCYELEFVYFDQQNRQGVRRPIFSVSAYHLRG
jgi:hypothetical protein